MYTIKLSVLLCAALGFTFSTVNGGKIAKQNHTDFDFPNVGGSSSSYQVPVYPHQYQTEAISWSQIMQVILGSITLGVLTAITRILMKWTNVRGRQNQLYEHPDTLPMYAAPGRNSTRVPCHTAYTEVDGKRGKDRINGQSEHTITEI